MVKIISFLSNDVFELSSNTYIVIDSFSNCLIIDPSRNDNKVRDYIINNNLTPKAILLTHSHFDHIRGVDSLVNSFNIPFYVEENDVIGLTDPKINCSASYHIKSSIIVKNKPILVKDYETLHILQEDILVISTPFHTVGSCCFYFIDSRAIFTGDSLFEGAIGRDDLPSSIPSKRKESISKLMSLKDDIKVYPGHGNATYIGVERNNNPFIKD